jgi:hypothetical protein
MGALFLDVNQIDCKLPGDDVPVYPMPDPTIYPTCSTTPIHDVPTAYFKCCCGP